MVLTVATFGNSVMLPVLLFKLHQLGETHTNLPLDFFLTKVKMKDLEHACVKVCFKVSNAFADTLKTLQHAYREDYETNTVIRMVQSIF